MQVQGTREEPTATQAGSFHGGCTYSVAATNATRKEAAKETASAVVARGCGCHVHGGRMSGHARGGNAGCRGASGITAHAVEPSPKRLVKR